MNRKELINGAEAININSIYFVDDKKKCEPHELCNFIKHDTLYKLELEIFNKYTCKELCQIFDELLISDLAKLVYNYLSNVQQVNMYSTYDDDDDNNVDQDLYFVLQTSVYNIYFLKHTFEIGIFKCTLECDNYKSIQNSHINHTSFGIPCLKCRYIILDDIQKISYVNHNTENELKLVYKLASIFVGKKLTNLIY